MLDILGPILLPSGRLCTFTLDAVEVGCALANGDALKAIECG